MDLHATDYYCHQFDYPSIRYQRSFAKRGIGPTDFLDAENIRFTSKGDCWILDANKSLLTCFPINAANFSKREIHLTPKLVRTLDLALYNDSLFIVPDYTGKHRFHILHSDGTLKESRGKISLSKKDKDIPDMVYAQAWRGFLDYNFQTGILAIATQLGEVIEIYDIPGDSLINVVYGKQGEPRFNYRNGQAIPTGIMGYSDIYVGEENIYALFWGQTFDEIKTTFWDIEGGKEIRVFDLKGNPVKQYFLDRYITGFCVDEKNKVIIGLDVNSDQPVVKMKI
jgi:hypothetical protein